LFYIKISPKIGYARKNDGTSQSYLEERVKYYDKLKSIYRTIEIDGEQKLDDIVCSIIHEIRGFLRNK
jgi:thymidylate kinase